MSTGTLYGIFGSGARAVSSGGARRVGLGAGGGFYARRWASFNTLWVVWAGFGVPSFPGRAPYLALVSLRLVGPQFQVPGLGLCLLAAWQGAAAERASGMAQALCGHPPLSAMLCRACGIMGGLTCRLTAVRHVSGTSGMGWGMYVSTASARGLGQSCV